MIGALGTNYIKSAIDGGIVFHIFKIYFNNGILQLLFKYEFETKKEHYIFRNDYC